MFLDLVSGRLFPAFALWSRPLLMAGCADTRGGSIPYTALAAPDEQQVPDACDQLQDRADGQAGDQGLQERRTCRGDYDVGPRRTYLPSAGRAGRGGEPHHRRSSTRS